MSSNEPKGASSEIKVLKRLIKLMNEQGLSELDIESEGMKVRLKKAGAGDPSVVVGPALSRPVEQTAAPAAPEAKPAESKNVYMVKSPIVGTFYRAPSPQAPPFVNAGDNVTEGQTLCLIEAMKLMNEIKAEKAGKVSRVLVENGVPVEFDQALIEIVPVSETA